MSKNFMNSTKVITEPKIRWSYANVWDAKSINGGIPKFSVSLNYFLGGCDGLLYALLVFVVIDYITAVMCVIVDKNLFSKIGFKGICRKVLIFLLVGIANVLDVQVIKTGSVLRTAVIFFYISNEGVSLLENAVYLGLPVPEKIKSVLEQLHDRAESGDK